MATHEIKPYANMTASKDKAPFLASYIQRSTAGFEDLVKDIAKEAGMSDTEARTILEGTPEIIESLEQEALTRFNLPGGIVIEPVAYGTLEAANSTWDNEKNSLELAFRMDEEFRNHLANLTPTIVTDVTITKADIYRVFDTDVPLPASLIHGKHRFRIQGKKLFPKAVYLENAAKQRFDCNVVTVDPDGNAYEAKSRDLLEPGDYKLIVETDAGDEGGILQYPAKSVKYLKVLPPAPKILACHSQFCDDEEGLWKVFKDTNRVYLENDIPDDMVVSMVLVNRVNDQEVARVVANGDLNKVIKLDDKTFTVEFGRNNSGKTDGTWCDAATYIVRLLIESSEGSTSIDLTTID